MQQILYSPRVTAKGTGPQGRSQCYLTPPTGGPVGHNPVALCNTQHTGKEILTRPTSEYFANDVLQN